MVNQKGSFTVTKISVTDKGRTVISCGGGGEGARAFFVPELSGTPFRILFSGRNGVPVTLCVLKAELRSGSVPPTPGQTPERGGSSIIVTTKKKKFRLRRAFITPVLQFRSRFH